jgi:hypothetical protein
MVWGPRLPRPRPARSSGALWAERAVRRPQACRSREPAAPEGAATKDGDPGRSGGERRDRRRPPSLPGPRRRPRHEDAGPEPRPAARACAEARSIRSSRWPGPAGRRRRGAGQHAHVLQLFVPVRSNLRTRAVSLIPVAAFELRQSSLFRAMAGSQIRIPSAARLPQAK